MQEPVGRLARAQSEQAFLDPHGRRTRLLPKPWAPSRQPCLSPGAAPRQPPRDIPTRIHSPGTTTRAGSLRAFHAGKQWGLRGGLMETPQPHSNRLCVAVRVREQQAGKVLHTCTFHERITSFKQRERFLKTRNGSPEDGNCSLLRPRILSKTRVIWPCAAHVLLTTVRG